jgi:hypothetical protein
MDPASRQRQLHTVVKRVTQMFGRRQPAVTFLEDLHWFDGASEAFLEPIVEGLPGTQGLVLVNFRPGYHAAWMQKSYYQQLPLLPLGPEATAELLRDLLGTDPSLATLAGPIRERTGGNPFFIEEMVQALAETGSLEGAKGAYRLVRSAAKLGLPSTVQAVLAARIDRLAEREKGVLQTAAVIGREFTEPILRRVAELPEAELAAALQRLTAAELIYEEALGPEPEYTFQHPLTQEVAYRSQLGARRERVHGEVARAIADLHRDRLDEKAALLAQHWEASGDALEATRWHDRAARWAARSHVMEAVQHWRKVRELVQKAAVSVEVADLDLRACLGLLDVAYAGLTEKEARVLYSAGKDLATRKGDLRTLALLSSAYAFFLVGYGLSEESIRYGEEALALAERLDNPWLKLTIRWGLLRALLWAERLQRGLSVAEAGLELSEAELEQTTPPAGTPPYGWFRAFLFFYKGEFLMPFRAAERKQRDCTTAPLRPPEKPAISLCLSGSSRMQPRSCTRLSATAAQCSGMPGRQCRLRRDSRRQPSSRWPTRLSDTRRCSPEHMEMHWRRTRGHWPSRKGLSTSTTFSSASPGRISVSETARRR